MKFFKKSEFECKCGCGKLPSMGIMVAANFIRQIAGEEIIINSAKRCKKHNEDEGGKVASRHLIGDAIDFRYMNNNTSRRLKAFHKKLIILFPDECGISLYDTFIHFDIRKRKARWPGVKTSKLKLLKK